MPQSTNLPAGVEVVRGDLAAPETIDEALQGVDTVFLVWVAPFAAAALAIKRIARHAEQIVLLTSPHRVQHPFFQQPNLLRAVHAGIEQLIEDSPPHAGTTHLVHYKLDLARREAWRRASVVKARSRTPPSMR
jgi:uncharacterized protein YbjT (DUF2867 family)